jgi:hypothetical protein
MSIEDSGNNFLRFFNFFAHPFLMYLADRDDNHDVGQDKRSGWW